MKKGISTFILIGFLFLIFLASIIVATNYSEYTVCHTMNSSEFEEWWEEGQNNINVSQKFYCEINKRNIVLIKKPVVE